jgi:hypothetical protein
MDTGIEMIDLKQEVNRRLELWNQYKAYFSFLGPDRSSDNLEAILYGTFSEEQRNFLDAVARKKIESGVRGNGYKGAMFSDDERKKSFLLKAPEDLFLRNKFFEIFKERSQPNGGKRRRTIKRRKKAKKRTNMRR